MGKRTAKRSHNWSSIASPYGRYRNMPAPKRWGCSPPVCRTLADMTEAEIVALEKHYGCPVIRPKKKRSSRRSRK